MSDESEVVKSVRVKAVRNLELERLKQVWHDAVKQRNDAIAQWDLYVADCRRQFKASQGGAVESVPQQLPSCDE